MAVPLRFWPLAFFRLQAFSASWSRRKRRKNENRRYSFWPAALAASMSTWSKYIVQWPLHLGGRQQRAAVSVHTSGSAGARSVALSQLHRAISWRRSPPARSRPRSRSPVSTRMTRQRVRLQHGGGGRGGRCFSTSPQLSRSVGSSAPKRTHELQQRRAPGVHRSRAGRAARRLRAGDVRPDRVAVPADPTEQRGLLDRGRGRPGLERVGLAGVVAGGAGVELPAARRADGQHVQRRMPVRAAALLRCRRRRPFQRLAAACGVSSLGHQRPARGCFSVGGPGRRLA